MEIKILQEQARVPVTIFRPVGRINLGNADQLIQKAQEAFAGGMRNLLIDLTEVPSMTSAGLRALNAIYKLLSSDSLPVVEDQTGHETRESPHLKLLNPDPEVRKVLNISGFDMFLDVYENKQDALRAF